MTAKTPAAYRLRVAHLNPRTGQDFDLAPDADARAAIATELDLLGLKALRFTGRLRAEGADAWALDSQLTARVVQPCAITLAPVETALNEQIRRVFSPHVTAPTEDEAEIGDETLEPLGQTIDLYAVMIEALALALPLYPRAPNAALPEPAQDDPADSEDRRRPFAGLADLLKNKE